MDDEIDDEIDLDLDDDDVRTVARDIRARVRRTSGRRSTTNVSNESINQRLDAVIECVPCMDNEGARGG